MQQEVKPDATLVKISSNDGYEMTFTVQELLTDTRYRYPNFKTGGDGDGYILATLRAQWWWIISLTGALRAPTIPVI